MKNIADILAACLDEIAAGTATVEECLARHEDIRGELEPLLRLGLDVEALPRISPSNAFKATTKAVLMEHVHKEQASRTRSSFGFVAFLRPMWVRALAITAAVVIVISSAGAGTVYAAGDSLPGETLYTVKTGWEDVRDWLETDDGASAALQIEFSGRRLEEIARLLEMDSAELSRALSGYDGNLQKALEDAVHAGSIGPLESVAANITVQLAFMDDLEDSANDVQILEQARETAMNRQMSALRSVAGYDAATAGNLTVSVMQQRMQRAAGANAHGQMKRTEQTLRQFLQYAGLCEEIRATAGEQGVVLDELYDSACLALQQSFTGIAGDVSPGLVEEIEHTFTVMKQHRYGQAEQTGSGNGQPDGQGMGPGKHSQQSGLQDQTKPAGEMNGTPDESSDEQGLQPTQTGETSDQNEQAGPPTTVTPPQQPAGPEQGPGQENPGPGPGNEGTPSPSGKPQVNNS